MSGPSWQVYIYGPLNYNPVERYFFDRVTRGRPVCVPYGGKYITQLGCRDRSGEGEMETEATRQI